MVATWGFAAGAMVVVTGRPRTGMVVVGGRPRTGMVVVDGGRPKTGIVVVVATVVDVVSVVGDGRIVVVPLAATLTSPAAAPSDGEGSSLDSSDEPSPEGDADAVVAAAPSDGGSSASDRATCAPLPRRSARDLDPAAPRR